MRITLCVILLSFSLLASAQQDTVVRGNLKIIQDTAITTLINTRPVLQQNQSVRGFRVQLASSPNRKEVYDLKSEFIKNYPDVRAYITYQQPYFKLRVGDFIERTAANQFRDIINSQFPGFIVPDNVNTNSDKE